MSDNVNHPAHYEVNGYQCIDVMESIYGKGAVGNFCLLNVFKYLWRAKRKNGIEDLKKAQWYLNRLIELEDMEGNDTLEEKLDNEQTIDD